MTRTTLHIHLDAIGGVAGDMFIAALCAAFPQRRAELLAAIAQSGLSPEVTCRLFEHRDNALTGLRFEVNDPHARAHHHAHAHGVHHEHDERPFAEIRAQLIASALPPAVVQRAVAIFTLLAEVEGEIHGMPTEQVSFHELGGYDSIADIVGAAALIEGCSGATWSVSALPIGRGRVRTAHGTLPVPSPAAARLLQGFEFVDDGMEGERVTPTGAAILKHLAANRPAPRYRGRLAGSGHGFGARSLPGMSNVLRVLAFEAQVAPAGEDRVTLIAFEVDDQPAEDLAIGLDRLRAHPGVLDVLQVPAFGKKGRMTVQVQILAQPQAAEAVFDACFSETSTLGLRWQEVERRVLARRMANVDLSERSVRVKIAQRPGAVTAKAESDDLATIAGGRRARNRARHSAQQAGLRDAAKRGGNG